MHYEECTSFHFSFFDLLFPITTSLICYLHCEECTSFHFSFFDLLFRVATSLICYLHLHARHVFMNSIAFPCSDDSFELAWGLIASLPSREWTTLLTSLEHFQHPGARAPSDPSWGFSNTLWNTDEHDGLQVHGEMKIVLLCNPRGLDLPNKATSENSTSSYSSARRFRLLWSRCWSYQL